MHRFAILHLLVVTEAQGSPVYTGLLFCTCPQSLCEEARLLDVPLPAAAAPGTFSAEGMLANGLSQHNGQPEVTPPEMGVAAPWQITSAGPGGNFGMRVDVEGGNGNNVLLHDPLGPLGWSGEESGQACQWMGVGQAGGMGVMMGWDDGDAVGDSRVGWDGTAPTDEAEPNHETHPEAPLTDLNDDPMVPDLVNAALERDLSRAVGPSQGEADAIAATADIEGCTRLRAPLTEGAGFELPPVDQTAAAAPTVSRRGRPPKAKGKAKQKQKGLRLREGTAPLSHTVQDPTETREPPSPSLFIAPAGTGGGGQRRVARADPKAKSKPSRFSKPKTRGRTVALAVSAVTGGKSDSDRKVAERSDPTGQPHTNPPTEAPAQSSARQGQTTQPAGTGSDDVLCGHSGPVSFISLQMAARKLRERLKLLALSGVSFDSTAASVRVSAQTASGNVLRFFPCFPEGREAELRSATLARLHPEHQAWANWGLVPLQCVDGAIEDALAFASLVYEKWHDEESCQMSRGFLEEAYRKGGRPVKGKILVRAAG
uniref:Uncharacterized protein n=1 Tax=Chromera velia CCMP2878 TaxID=1169474 RepID=A0A0G4F4P8_9ALVE|eukprot:Cvel_15067.t1-p1 / transcript=Cvel_15067.t1 / gene=Cvel_15067 / organism=Chromera_velia_CCMP2878 / gene_product=hypothetical protein / transcript_product=hypothetical protein / location=Cvel_scaffold1098:26199-31710(-) / protein_length=540 / sequence_SO=supercontig / SO=protein_coding / is_pseudo=false